MTWIAWKLYQLRREREYGMIGIKANDAQRHQEIVWKACECGRCN